jgi:signal transduction histidine kinase
MALTDDKKLISPLQSHLGRRILFILVLLSGTITLIATAAQLYFDYNQQFRNIEKRHQEIRSIHARTLATSLWSFDITHLQQKLNGLCNLPYIDYLEIRATNYTIRSGKPVSTSNNMIQHTYPITYQEPISKEIMQIGTIRVESDVQDIYDALTRDIFTTIAINITKTVLVCYLILLVFHRSINQRIFAIVRYMRQYNPIDPHSQQNRLDVHCSPLITQKNDELSLLVRETNKLTKNISTFYLNSRFEQTRLTDFARISSDWLWETDASLNLIYCSEVMQRALDLEESHQRPFQQIEPFQSAHQLQQLLHEKQSFSQCEEELALYGGKQWLMFQAQARYSEDNEFLGFRGTALNISELKAVQFELETLNQNLEQTVQQRMDDLAQNLERLKQTHVQLIQSEKLTALGRLVAGVAHEVNAPLGIAITAISSIEEVMNEYEDSYNNQTLSSEQFIQLTERLKASSQLLQHNLNRAAKLVQDFKQTAVDQVSESQCRFNIHHVLMSLIASMHPETVKIPVSPVLDGDKTLMMSSLPGTLTQIIANLIMNSTTHAFGGIHRPSQIRIQFYEEKQSIVFEYQDNGIGVAKELHEKIFEPFYTTKRGCGGSGLGLSLVFNLVQKLQGTLQFSSEPDQGVHYCIRLPKEIQG